MRTSRPSSPIAPPSTPPTRASAPAPKSASTSQAAPTSQASPTSSAPPRDTYSTKPQRNTATANVSGTSANAPRKLDNTSIRTWYNQQVSTIPAMDAKMKAEGVPAHTRAEAAHKIRHDARIEARRMMSDPREVEDLRKRDTEKYGNPDGPTFEQLVAKAKKSGLEGEAVYESIIGSSNRTNEEVNARFNQGGAQAPPGKARL